VIKLAPTPFSPNKVPANFYLFHLLKSISKGRRLCDAIDITENAKEKQKKNFTERLAGIFPTPLQLLAELHKRTFLKEI
jgi:hypothetical protein